jgi:hypothetical protein
MKKYYNIPYDVSALESIQGGKIQHVFKINKMEDESSNNLYNNNFSCKEAEEAFNEGTWTVKFHGSNGFITKKNNDLILWERRDIKNKVISELKIDSRIMLLDDINKEEAYTKAILPSLYSSHQKQHHYIFVEIKRDSKMGTVLYPRINELLKDEDILYQSVEFVGKKIQGNENQFNWRDVQNKNYGIVFHSSVIFNPFENFSLKKENTFATLTEIAQKEIIEGWVIYHKRTAWKIRMNLLQPKDKCAFDSKKETTIKPFVY